MADKVSFGSSKTSGAVVFVDNSSSVNSQMEKNVTRALDAMGIKAVGMVVHNMQEGYETPIRDTGNLMRDVNYHVTLSNKTVAIGNTLEYSLPVHDGTRKMKGRPYLRDTLTDSSNIDTLRNVAGAYLKQGFDK